MTPGLDAQARVVEDRVVAANGTLYLATSGGWLWAVGQGK
jgi:hypothetical protein